MSSSNLVQVAAIEETVYGETPAVGNFETTRFTSETLSGTPETTESAQIRTDRQSSGQVVTGLTVGGDVNFELAKEDVIDQFMAAAMYSNWVASAPVAADIDIDATLQTLTRAAGDFNADLSVGDIITTTGFSNAVNNNQFQVLEIVSATEIRVAMDDTVVDESSTGNTFQVADYLDIGTTKKSFSIEKRFLDLIEKGIVYRGEVVDGMTLNVAYGEIANGNFSFLGNDYKPFNSNADSITDGRTLNPSATSNSLNGSVDMPWIINGATGTFEESSFCIQSLNIALTNNNTAQTCIGRVAPQDYSPGTASVALDLSAYLADSNWEFLSKKLTQEPFEIGGLIRNIDGFYGFYIPQAQVSFEDPASPGQNQDVILTTSGVAKVGANGESQLRLFRS